VSVDDVEFALLKRSVETLRSEQEHLEEKIEGMEALDNRRIRSSVVALGAIVLSLTSYIWFLFNSGNPS